MKINWKKIGYTTGFIIVAMLMVWINGVSTPDNQNLMAFLIISIFTNLLILMIALGTGIGIEATRNFTNKFRYKSGKYVQTLLMMKGGIIRKYFKKKDDELDTIKINKKSYAMNPKLRFVYKGIPTYIHREGTPDPLNVFDDKLAGDLSCAELDNVMNSKGVFDLKQWLETNKAIILLAAMIMVGAAVVSAFFGYLSYEMLRDGTFKIGSVACSNIPQPQILTGGTL